MLDSRRTARRLLLSSAVVMTARFLVAVGGFLSAVLIASLFGARYESDAYFVARLVPIVFTMTLAVAFNLAFIPVYTRTLSEAGSQAASSLADDFRAIVFWTSAAFTLLYVLFADWIVALLAPGFSAEARHLTVTLTRIMAPAVVLVNLYAVTDSVLNAEHRYTASSLASLCLPLGNLLGIVLLADAWGLRMPGVAAGVLAGSALQWAVVGPAVRGKFRRPVSPGTCAGCAPAASGRAGLFSIDLGNPRLRESVIKLGALLAVVGVWQLDLAVNRIFASLLGEGAVSAFGFAFVFIGTVPSIMAMPVYKVLYPEMLRLAAARDFVKLRQLFHTNIFVMALVIFPLSMILVSFSRPIIAIAFGYGHFDDAAAAATADVIAFMSLGLWPVVTCILMNFYFCATGRPGLLMWLGLALVAADATMAYVLMQVMGIAGIATAYSLTAVASLVVTGAFLSRDLGGLDARTLIGPLGKLAAAAVLAGIVLHYAAGWLTSVAVVETVFEQLVAYGSLSVVGLATYLGINLLLGNDRMVELAAALRDSLTAPRVTAYPLPLAREGGDEAAG